MSSMLRLASVFVLIATSGAAATPLVIDQFKIGTDRANGEYTSGTAINNAASYNTSPNVLVNQGFVNGGYSGGTGSSNFSTTAGTLNVGSLSDEVGGKVAWAALPATATAVVRSTGRSLSPALTTPPVYYTAQLLNRGTDVAGFDPSASAFVGFGFGNTVVPQNPGASNITGFYLGYAGTGATDDDGSLVIRTRTAANQGDQIVLVDDNVNSTQNTTFLVVTKAEKDYLGGSADRLTYWVNPTDFSSEAAMTASSFKTGSFEFLGLQGGTSDLARLTFIGTAGAATGDVFRSTAFFDEIKLGETLADVVPVPEPTTLAALGLAGLLIRRRK